MSETVFRARTLVIAALRESAAARDDDNTLVLNVWRRCGLEVAGDAEALAATLPQVETIRRARARVQNVEGRYLPSPEVLAKRRMSRRAPGGEG